MATKCGFCKYKIPSKATICGHCHAEVTWVEEPLLVTILALIGFVFVILDLLDYANTNIGLLFFMAALFMHPNGGARATVTRNGKTTNCE